MPESPLRYTDRLILRKLQYEDLPALIKYANNQKVADKIMNIPHPFREPDAAFRLSYVVQGWKKKTRFTFAIILKETQELIGEIAIHLIDPSRKHAQLAYWIGEPFWNQGLTTEAAAEILKFGFQTMGYELIYADCYADHIASQRVMIKNNMREHHNQGNLKVYRLTKDEYQQQVSA